MNRYFTIIILLCIFCLSALAQKLENVKGEYTYSAKDYETLEQARRTASYRAKIQALADHFGTVVSQYNTTRMQNDGEKSEVDFFSSGESAVKGEWIETIYEEFDNPVFKDGELFITCRVKGKARKIVSTKIGVEALVLRGGTSKDYEDDVFMDGNLCYLSFRSPVKGYLAVYLIDEFQQANRVIPSEGEGCVEIAADSTYVLNKEPFLMTLEGGTVQNEFCFVFSPQPFGLEASESAKHMTDLRRYELEHRANFTLPPVLSLSRFEKWQGSLRSKDANAQVVKRLITINPKK